MGKHSKYSPELAEVMEEVADMEACDGSYKIPRYSSKIEWIARLILKTVLFIAKRIDF